MLAGHIGAGLAIARLERRVNAAVFIGAALLLDVVLWLFVLLGWERVDLPDDFSRTHQPWFEFPYSHSLLAAAGWSAAAALLGWRLFGRLRAGALLAAAVLSHWLLDLLVHRPELPLAGLASPRLGLGLWDHMPLALLVEGAIVLIGLGLFVPGSGLTRARSIALALLVLIVLAFTVLGMTVAPPPPSVQAMAGSSLGTLAVLCLLAGWFGRRAGSVPA